MKAKIFLLTAAALTIAAACSKQAQEPAAPELYPVSFNLTGLAVEYGEITKAGESETPQINSLAYFLYSGTTLKDSKNYTAAEFANLDLSNLEIYIPSGEYTIYFCAGGTDSSDPLTIGTGSYNNTNYAAITDKGREIFSGSATINSETAAEYAVTLTRKTGAIALNITDIENAPSGFTRVLFGTYTPVKWMPLWGTCENTTTTTNRYCTPEELAAGAYLSLWPRGAMEINIVAYSGATEIARAQVSAAVYANRKTIITGPLFGASGNFGVSVDSSWGEDNEVTL